MKKLSKKFASLLLLWLTKKELESALLMDSKGNFIKPFNLECTTLDLEVVGLALCRIKRFFGQTRLSVAQHSVNMARIFIYLDEKELAKQALLHEVAEAFMGDLASPLKRAFPMFKEIEESLIKKTFKCYGLSYPMANAVHILDKQMMIDEAVVHMPKQDYWISLGNSVEPQLLQVPGVELDAWGSQRAYKEFMETAKELELI
jgi:hypothetical protein